MPVKKFGSRRSPEFSDYVARLASEWNGSESNGTGAPVILEEDNGRGEVVHVYVVWDEWSSMSREQRSEVIMDAAERVKPLDQVLKITIALGLTKAEADRLGISYDD